MKKNPTADYITRYYSMHPSAPSFVGGSFYWYFCSQAVPKGSVVWNALNSAMSSVI